MNRHLTPLTTLVTVMTMIGCQSSESDRLVEMAQRHEQRQFQQTETAKQLQAEISEGTRHLIEADATARREWTTLQRELSQQQDDLNRQRDALEIDRKSIAQQRRTDAILAVAIEIIGTAFLCLIPLSLCWLLLQSADRPASDQVVAELLLEDLILSEPKLLVHTEQQPKQE